MASAQPSNSSSSVWAETSSASFSLTVRFCANILWAKTVPMTRLTVSIPVIIRFQNRFVKTPNSLLFLHFPC